jgi:hypothetical protein
MSCCIAKTDQRAAPSAQPEAAPLQTLLPRSVLLHDGETIGGVAGDAVVQWEEFRAREDPCIECVSPLWNWHLLDWSLGLSATRPPRVLALAGEPGRSLPAVPHQIGDEPFGAIMRISATTRLGEGEVIDIQRETHLGGPIHAKGVLILASFVATRYSRFNPHSIVGSLVFEQTYGIVEGDSASLAELASLLSSIGDVPIKQCLAVTGSVDQFGAVQAVGGVNEKIEAFFDLCSARGLDGSHGVIVPQATWSI